MANTALYLANISNTVFVTINAASEVFNVTNAAFNKANAALPNVSNVTFAGNLFFPTNTYVGLGTNSPNVILSIIGNNTIQSSKQFMHGCLFDAEDYDDEQSTFTVVRNAAAATNTSSDILAVNDFGEFIDVGINSSLYNNPSFSSTGPGDGYLYVTNNSIGIGTLADANINFFAGGSESSNIVAKLSTKGVMINAIKGPYANDSVASVNGVPLKTLYYDATGVVKIRLV
jgi:hypothetical protein